MLALSSEDLIHNTDLYTSCYGERTKSMFTEKDYLEKIIPRMVQEANRKYPYQVKIPKSVEEMLQGDFEPAKVFTVEKPIMGPFGEMWFGDASKGMTILCGYKNGDSRYNCDTALGDDNVHGILVGATGQGKSVTQNAIIYGANYIYPPWELNMILCDAKIVEFKSIALNNPMPQIQAIGATQDADYLVSVLEEQATAMKKRQAMFAIAGKHFGTEIKKIEDFRKVTGLALPQVILDMDEFQAMFSNAKKKLNAILKAIDDFARLGRATGFHLLMASQELGSDMPKNTLANIKIRMAMGCNVDVSSQILGNPRGVDNYGKRGYMYINTDGGSDTKGERNVLYRVPFPTPDQIQEMSSSIIEKGHEFDVTPALSFYDEDAVVHTSEYSDYLKQFNVGKDRIYLGEPAFVLHDKEQCVKLKLTGENIENILINAPTDQMLARYVTMIKKNIELHDKVVNVVHCARSELEKLTKVSELGKNLYFDETQYTGSNFYSIARFTIYKRKLVVEADKQLEAGIRIANETSNKLFDERFGNNAKFRFPIFKERFAHYLNIMQTSIDIQNGFGLSAGSYGSTEPLKLSEDMIKYAMDCMTLCDSWGYEEKIIGKDEVRKALPFTYFWDLGVDRVIGLGRSAKSKEITEYLRLLQDSTAVNCRFIVATSTMEDITSLMGGIRWVLMEAVSSSEIGKMKCSEHYPDTVLGSLAVLWDKSLPSDACVKFKKMLHDGEIPM